MKNVQKKEIKDLLTQNGAKKVTFNQYGNIDILFNDMVEDMDKVIDYTNTVLNLIPNSYKINSGLYYETQKRSYPIIEIGIRKED